MTKKSATPAKTKAPKPFTPVDEFAEVADDAPPPTPPETHEVDLSTLSNQADNMLNNLVEDLERPAKEAQREEDELADFEDSEYGRKLRAKFEKLQAKLKEQEQIIAQKGIVLAGGRPQYRLAKEKIVPGKAYENFPVKTIDGKPVRFVSSRPFYDKHCAWDDGHVQTSEHFVQSEHPNYANAVYCHIPNFINFDKSVKEAYVVRTDEEIQLFFVGDN